MLTKRDKEIIRYIEDNGFITISQCCNMWFADRKYGYDLARKRLAEIERQEYCKSFINHKIYAPEKIFYIEKKYANPSKHTILTMNAYSEIIKLGADILYFKREQSWLEGKYKSDGFVIFKMDKYVYAVCIETIVGTGVLPYMEQREKLNGKYYEIIYVEDEVQNAVDIVMSNYGINDRINANKCVLIIDEIDHKNPWTVDEVRTYQIHYDMKGIGKILL